jgi:hypothetical protein
MGTLELKSWTVFLSCSHHPMLSAKRDIIVFSIRTNPATIRYVNAFPNYPSKDSISSGQWEIIRVCLFSSVDRYICYGGNTTLGNQTYLSERLNRDAGAPLDRTSTLCFFEL